MALPAVFISYNPNSDVEQTLAIRLHTIGRVHGFDMQLPDRTSFNKSVSQESKSRILMSDFFICFSTSSLTDLVQDEIDIAFSKLQDKSRILVIFDEKVGSNIHGAENCTQVFINTQDNPLNIVTEITKKIKEVQNRKSGESFLSGLGGLLLLGLGLFALADVFDTPSKPKKKSTFYTRRQPAKKTAKKARRKNA